MTTPRTMKMWSDTVVGLEIKVSAAHKTALRDPIMWPYHQGVIKSKGCKIESRLYYIKCNSSLMLVTCISFGYTLNTEHRDGNQTLTTGCNPEKILLSGGLSKRLILSISTHTKK